MVAKTLFILFLLHMCGLLNGYETNQVACEYPGDRAEADQPDVLLETLPVLIDRGVRLVLSLAANESSHTH